MSLSDQNKAILRTWVNSFVSAILGSLITVLTIKGNLDLDWDTIKAVLYSGVIAVLPVIRNYFSNSYDQYGKGSQ